LIFAHTKKPLQPNVQHYKLVFGVYMKAKHTLHRFSEAYMYNMSDVSSFEQSVKFLRNSRYCNSACLGAIMMHTSASVHLMTMMNFGAEHEHGEKTVSENWHLLLYDVE
jgi:hypothetical protein